MSNTPHSTTRQHFRKEDDARALQMLLRMGTVYEVDCESVPPKARIESGELITDFLPFPCDMGHNFRRWRAARVGAQVLFACPSGDTRQGVIVKFYNTTDHPQPETDPAVDLVEFDDGTILRKDGEELRIDSAVPVYIKAEQITLDGNVLVTGGDLVKAGGSVTHDGVLIDKTHVHLIIVPVPATPVTPPMLP